MQLWHWFPTATHDSQSSLTACSCGGVCESTVVSHPRSWSTNSADRSDGSSDSCRGRCTRRKAPCQSLGISTLREKNLVSGKKCLNNGNRIKPYVNSIKGASGTLGGPTTARVGHRCDHDEISDGFNGVSYCQRVVREACRTGSVD